MDWRSEGVVGICVYKEGRKGRGKERIGGVDGDGDGDGGRRVISLFSLKSVFREFIILNEADDVKCPVYDHLSMKINIQGCPNWG